MTEAEVPLIRAKRMIPDFSAASYSTDRLDLAIDRDSLVCVVGPDSSGRRHYLRTLAGIDVPARGSVRVLDQQLPGITRDEWRRLKARVAYIGADTALFANMDGLQNVMFPALYHRLDAPGTLEARAREIMEELSVADYAHVFPAHMGGIQRAKLVVARALNTMPKILFLDNPFRTLDVLAAEGLTAYLLQLRDSRSLAQVWSTDNLAFAERHGDLLLFVSRGRTRVFSSTTDLQQSTITEVKWFLDRTGQTQRIV